MVRQVDDVVLNAAPLLEPRRDFCVLIRRNWPFPVKDDQHQLDTKIFFT